MTDPTEDLVPEDDTVIAGAFAWSMAVLGVLLLAAAAVWLLAGRDTAPEAVIDAPAVAPVTRTADISPPPVRFSDLTAASGIDFVHETGAYGDRLLPETMGSGLAVFDMDGDADLDLYFVNSREWPWRDAEGPPATAALYRNDGGRFTDVSRGSGLDVPMYGMGVAVGDYDGDGRRDLFVTAVGENRLFRNVGDGRFEDATAAAGVAGDADRWSTSAMFFDYDRDGDLDLFVANYVEWSREIDFEVDYRLTGIGRAYGPPTNYAGTHNYLYRNDGEGEFTDVSAAAGIEVVNKATGLPMGKGLGVIAADMDSDGWLDVLVANDTVQNFLFRNLGDGRFREVGTVSGVAFDNTGAATGAMGLDVAQLGPGNRIAAAIGNFANEMTSYYVSPDGEGMYTDEAIISGIGPESRRALSFGLFFFDYDLDGRLDLFQTSGHIEHEINIVQPSQHYEQPSQLFWNCGSECSRPFLPVPEESIGQLGTPVVGRGAAYGDLDGDADLDLVITQSGRRPLLLRNDQSLGHHWLRVKLEGTARNRDAIGARVELTAAGETQRRTQVPARSYLSSVESTLTFGLGSAERVDTLGVMWPDGTRSEMSGVAVDQTLVLKHGE
ncbi:MAG: CRTAC1 family protein [Gammaproteobacteria bacterium]